jgi:spermidine synthase
MDKENYFSEHLVAAHRQQLQCTEILFSHKAETQEVVIFSNPRFGTVLALDHVIQTTERDEFVYHEMMTHVPILSHGAVKNVLIIGGGDGGILRHALMHKNIDQVTLVEIEPAVIEMTKQYLPTICGEAFDNPRARVIIDDGCAFVRDTKETFDIVIVDSTDNHGPGAVLFSKEFYANCKKCLHAGGIMVTQSGVPFTQPETLQLCRNHIRHSFKAVSFYMATVPTYISGPMAFGFACDYFPLTFPSPEILEKRFAAASLTGLQYYTPAVHLAAFALPRYVETLL